MALMDQETPEAAAPGAGDQGAASSFNNPLLGKVEAHIESTLTPENRTNYLRIVTAGMKVVMQGGPQGMITRLTQSKDPMATATAGPINLIMILGKSMKPGQGKMPVTAMIPAAMALMLHALDILDKTGVLKVDEGVLETAVKKFSDNVFRAFNISTQQIQKMSDMTHGAVTSHGGVDQLHQHAEQILKGGRPAPPQPGPGAPPPGATPLQNQ